MAETLWARGAALFVLACVAGAVRPLPVSAEMQALERCVLVEAAGNDGDSVRVRAADGREFTLRLYYVDCPETSADSETDARRVRAQTAYFGLPSHADTLAFGRKATDYVREKLSKPFTVHTAFASAPGRSKGGRVYGFVQAPDGTDLGEALVAAGLARAFGVRRATPDGRHRDEATEHLRDLELSAALGRKGIWGRSDPTRLVVLRAAARAEAAELRSVRDEAAGTGEDVGGRVNVNTASRGRLATLPGIGVGLADRIIAGRPYTRLDELTRVKGIGPATLEKLRDHATAGMPEETDGTAYELE